MKRSYKNRLSVVLFAGCIFVFLFEISHRNPPHKNSSVKQSYLGVSDRASGASDQTEFLGSIQ